MTGLQTEPFTAPLEPFTTPAGVEEGSEDARYEDVASEPSSATTFENGARKTPKNRQLTVYLPDDVHTRLVRQIERERRQMRVVMDKCVSDFLKDDAEPRPYLPAVFAGRMGQYTFCFFTSPRVWTHTVPFGMMDSFDFVQIFTQLCLQLAGSAESYFGSTRL